MLFQAWGKLIQPLRRADRHHALVVFNCIGCTDRRRGFQQGIVNAGIQPLFPEPYYRFVYGERDRVNPGDYFPAYLLNRLQGLIFGYQQQGMVRALYLASGT